MNPRLIGRPRVQDQTSASHGVIRRHREIAAQPRLGFLSPESPAGEADRARFVADEQVVVAIDLTRKDARLVTEGKPCKGRLLHQVCRRHAERSETV